MYFVPRGAQIGWSRWWLVGVCLTSLAQAEPKTVENDFMYPAVPAARHAIDFDGAGFQVAGDRLFLSSGSLHYPRVPHELWRDRLQRVKQAGFAAVETYAFWNYHEQKENIFDFQGDKDLGRFLDAAQEMGLYATVRVGPYVCAEWDFGGYPVWLKFKPPFVVRADNPVWTKWSDHWYETILPLVARHQINHGGNVVLLQLENEHPQGWGVISNAYFNHLHDTALKQGVEIPHFMSGQHHGATPVPGNLDPAKRSTPWITTEFWCGWYNTYGDLKPERNREIENAVWRIIAHGGGGYNFYMLHGGTDFDTWNNDEVAASYDDGAVIGQAGDLRPMYYRLKRQNQLTQSFPDILANGRDVLTDFAALVSGSGVEILGARASRNGAGTLVFVHNQSPNPTVATFNSGGQLILPGNANYPLPHDLKLMDGVRLVDGTLPVLARTRNGTTVTLVVYGPQDATGQLLLDFAEPANSLPLLTGKAGIEAHGLDARHVELTVRVPTNGVAELDLPVGSGNLRVLAINESLSLYTWISGAKDCQYLVFGPAYMQALQRHGRQMSVVMERPYGQPPAGRVAVYGGKSEKWSLSAVANPSADVAPAPALQTWTCALMPETEPAFDDAQWRQTKTPEQMGADGDISAFAWYRTRIVLPTNGMGTLHFQGGDDLEFYLNGRSVVSEKDRCTAEFSAGTNFLAVFASHHGRNKNYNYLGSLVDRDNKGLWGRFTLEFKQQSRDVLGWRMRGGVNQDRLAIRHWQPLANPPSGPAFFRTTFQATPPEKLGAHPIWRVNYKGLTRGTFWINGHNLGRYPEKINIDSLYVPECWLRKGSNELIVFDEAGAVPEQISLISEKAAGREVLVADQPAAESALIQLPE